MYWLVYKILVLFSAASVWVTAIFPASLPAVRTNTDISALIYPQDAVRTLGESGLSDSQWASRADGGEEYEAARGWDDVNAVMESPYYTAAAAGKEIPVYATTAFLGSTQKGTLQSFSEIYAHADAALHIPITLRSGSVRLRNAVVLPQSSGVQTVCRGGTVRAVISDFGIYTFLFNGEKQDYAFTLFVRKETDEEKEIAVFRERYGESRVRVFDAGVHEIDCLHTADVDGSVLYLRRGAYLIARHKFDIRNAADEARYAEDGARENNGIGLTRYPFINFYRCENVHVVGYGAIDLSHLDRRERRGVVFTECNGVTLRGVKIFNSPEWACITYQCRDVDISSTDIFGYRMNADAFALCNTQNARVTDCFARSGDDLFDVKALGGNMDSGNITFSGCVAWNGKARCFGICGEAVRGIRDVTFRDCSVVWRDATWDNDRVCSLAVIVEDGGGCIENVTFENIEIFRDEGRAIGCVIYSEDVHGFSVRNVRYTNVTYMSALPSKITADNGTGNCITATADNVKANGLRTDRWKCAWDVGKEGTEVRLLP